MKNTFTLFDIENLKEAVEDSSLKYDLLPEFLESYAWEDIYTTEDNSTVFSTRDIEVEFFNLDQPLNRECSVLYAENGNSQILYL
jgi:hypothetical protein